jgi:hypothetical protein
VNRKKQYAADEWKSRCCDLEFVGISLPDGFFPNYWHETVGKFDILGFKFAFHSLIFLASKSNLSFGTSH